MTRDPDEARDRAIEAEEGRLRTLTVGDLIDEYQVVPARLAEVTGHPQGYDNPTTYGFDLASIIGALAAQNLEVEP